MSGLVPADQRMSQTGLNRFKKAKIGINDTYNTLEELLTETHNFLLEFDNDSSDKLAATDFEKRLVDWQGKLEGIKVIIGRNQMKCAFFGRTSSGKSAVVNALLGSRILPMGIGHTTNCFLSIAGTDQQQGFLIVDEVMPGANGQSGVTPGHPLPVESVAELGSSLSGAGLPSESLVRLHWPVSRCPVLGEEVVLLDSPGVDVTPDTDLCIEKYCRDADVFVLVANAESTLMQTEKNFFHRVSEKLSKPNIFILNNRWDVAAHSEDNENLDGVREQHMERLVNFLVQELEACSPEEAAQRIYFVSALEVLKRRMAGEAVATAGSPSGDPEWLARCNEFQRFEETLMLVLSTSAIRTKFGPHVTEGRQLASGTRAALDAIHARAVEKKEELLASLQSRLQRQEEISRALYESKQQTHELIGRAVETAQEKVGLAFQKVLRELHTIVFQFARPFRPDAVLLVVYKKELAEWVERELNRRLDSACGQPLDENTKTALGAITALYTRCLETDQPTTTASDTVQDETDTSSSHHIVVNVPQCAAQCLSGFQEDIGFEFSLSPSRLFTWITGRRSTRAGDSDSRVGPAASFFSDLFPSLMSRNTMIGVVTVGVVMKVTGWRVVGVCGAVYGGLYLYEYWTHSPRVQEKALKKQFSNHAATKIRQLIGVTASATAAKTKSVLQSETRSLERTISQRATELSAEVEQTRASDLQFTVAIEEARKLRNSAALLDNQFHNFEKSYLDSTRYEISDNGDHD